MKSERDEYHDSLKVLLAEGKIEPDLYMKGMVALALDWMEGGDVEEALYSLTEVTDDYINRVLPVQMREDSTFGLAAHDLANKLVEAGVAAGGSVDPWVAIASMSKPAKA